MGVMLSADLPQEAVVQLLQMEGIASSVRAVIERSYAISDAGSGRYRLKQLDRVDGGEVVVSRDVLALIAGRRSV